MAKASSFGPMGNGLRDTLRMGALMVMASSRRQMETLTMASGCRIVHMASDGIITWMAALITESGIMMRNAVRVPRAGLMVPDMRANSSMAASTGMAATSQLSCGPLCQSLPMCRIVFLLACLVHTGHGQQVRSSEGAGNAMQALVELLKAARSTEAFNPSMAQARPVSYHGAASSRKSPVLMAEMRVDVAGDGGTYSEAEFREYYQDKFEEMWNAAEPAPEMKTFEELNIGDEVTATVKNIAPFGAFCSIGAQADALLHVSQIKDEFISDINEHVSVGEELTAWIKELDPARGRIGITCRQGQSSGGGMGRAPANPDATPVSELEMGQEVTGKVKTIMSFGAFVDIGAQADALLHISEICNEFVGDVNEKLEVGQEVTGRIKELDADRGRIGMSCRDEDEGDSDSYE